MASVTLQGSAVVRKRYFGPKQVSVPTDSRLLQQGDVHSLFSLGSVFRWRVHGNFTAKLVREVWGPHFVSFVSWWLACISLTQVNMPTNVPPAHFPPWQSASWKSTPWKCMGKHWHYQDPALSTLQPHTPTTPPRTTLLLKKWRTLMVRGASEQEFNCPRCHLIFVLQKTLQQAACPKSSFIGSLRKNRSCIKNKSKRGVVGSDLL